MTTPTIRAALERLVELDSTIITMRSKSSSLAWAAALAAARTALDAEPVGDGPSGRIVSIAKAVQGQAHTWEPDTLLIGNVCAEDVADLCDAVIDRWGLPLNYIDPEHQGDDRELLETFYGACNAEGGTADEIHLRGIRAVLATRPAAPPAPEVGRVAIPCHADIAVAMVLLGEGYLREHAPDRLRPAAPPAPEVGKSAHCARIELVTAIHCLASHFETACSDLDGDDLQKAKNDIAHARRIAANHNQNGTGCPQFPSVTPAAPEPGEVGELVAWIHRQAIHGPDADEWRRAAALLQQQQHSLKLALQAQLDLLMEQLPAPAPAVVPVAVAERPWEREGWCDEQGYCWFFYPQFNTWSWERPPVALTRGVGRFLSLPHHAIPLPQPNEAHS